tara:strand:+ start:151279 stop:151779 length:501 start_codon:yes stop_codon:yes gene_type:complete
MMSSLRCEETGAYCIQLRTVVALRKTFKRIATASEKWRPGPLDSAFDNSGNLANKESRQANAHRLSEFQRFQRLDRANIFCSWSLWSVPSGVGNLLSFVQLLELDIFEVRHVEEHIVPSTRVDESEALFSQLFDRTFSHYFTSSRNLCSNIRNNEFELKRCYRRGL